MSLFGHQHFWGPWPPPTFRAYLHECRASLSFSEEEEGIPERERRRGGRERMKEKKEGQMSGGLDCFTLDRAREGGGERPERMVIDQRGYGRQKQPHFWPFSAQSL